MFSLLFFLNSEEKYESYCGESKEVMFSIVQTLQENYFAFLKTLQSERDNDKVETSLNQIVHQIASKAEGWEGLLAGEMFNPVKGSFSTTIGQYEHLLALSPRSVVSSAVDKLREIFMYSCYYPPSGNKKSFFLYDPVTKKMFKHFGFIEKANPVMSQLIERQALKKPPKVIQDDLKKDLFYIQTTDLECNFKNEVEDFINHFQKLFG